MRLFERGAACLRLTDEGRTLLSTTQEPLDELAADCLRWQSAMQYAPAPALYPSTFVSDDIACRRLASWGTLDEDPLEFWALHASARLPSRKVRAFMAMAVETFAASAEGAQGDN